jgi:PAS domain S-box-containing protein
MFTRLITAAFVALLLFCAPAQAQQQASAKGVLLLHWYNKEYEGGVIFDKYLQAEVRAAEVGKVEFYFEYLESNRFAGEAHAVALRDYLRQKYADRSIDVVVAVTDVPLDFLLKYRNDLFTNIPIVFIAAKRPAPEQLVAGPGMTGIFPVSTHRETLALALRLHPDTEQVFFVSGTLEHDKRFETIARKELQSYENKVRINYLTDLPLDELIARTRALPERSIILYAWQQSLDGQGRVLETYDTLPAFAPTSSVPIYGMATVNIGRGLIGGYVAGSETNATRIGELTARILKGERAQEIFVEDAPAVYMFDAREMKRWGIRDESLPAGSIIRYKESSFWELYKNYIFGVVAIIIIESSLIAWLLIVRRQRRRAERERERFGTLAESEQRHLGEIVSMIPGIVWETLIDRTTNTRRTTFISDYVEKMLGYTADEWLAEPPGFGFRIMPEEDHARATRASEAVMSNGKDVITQYRWWTKNGRLLWIESHLSPIIEEDGKIVGLRGVSLDITEKKLADDAQRQSEERNRAILQAIPDLMFLQTRDGVYLDYHAKDGKDLLDPSGAFLGKNMRDVLSPELAERFFNCFQLIYETGEPQVVEYELNIEGQQRWYESRLVLSGENILSVVRDVTGRKAAGEALRQSELRLRRAQQAARVGTWEWNVQTGASIWSEMIWELLGLEPGEGEPTVEMWIEAVHPEDRDRALRKVNEVFAEGDEYSDEFRIIRRDGKVLWVASKGGLIRSPDGRPERMLGVNIDITARKLAEEALRNAMAMTERHRAQLDSIFQTVSDGIMVSDMEGNIFLVNQAMARIHEYESAEEMMHNLSYFATRYELFDPDGQRIPYDEWPMSRVLKGESITDWELRVCRKDKGREWLCNYSGEPVHDERGEQVLALLVTHDITERKAGEAALRESEEKYRTLFESIDEGFCVFELICDDGGRAVDAVFTVTNPAFGRQTGWKDANGKRFSELIPDLEEFWFEKYALIANTGEPDRFTGRAAALDRWFDVYAFRVGEQGSLTVAVIFSDVSERIRAEEALRESEARFRDMADTAPVMIWLANPDKLCTYFNKQWLDFTGRSMDEEFGHGWAEGIHPDDYARCLDTYISGFDKGEPFKMEYRLRRADGAFHWVIDIGTPRFSSTGEFLGYIGSCVDINDRKESEEALHEMMEEVNRLKNQLQEENIYLREEIKLEHNFSEIVGHSDAIKYVLHKIEQVAPTDSTVLITGETGTGKELVARAIHSESQRRSRPLVKVNCAALSASLIESELFGHEKGAFTGAASRKIGRFELADGATIFLDEIGELPPELQVKLLRVLQEGEFERLGSNRTIKVTVRVIAATNRNLWEEVRKGSFREDLWYRLNVFPITMPPLRQRTEDIPLLVEHFVNRFSKRMGKQITEVAPATLHALRNYSWPGNVRELANVIERAVINNAGPVLHILNISEALQAEHVEEKAASNKTLEEMEREYIIAVLGSTGWRIEGPHGAAGVLGLHPSTLRTRMAKLKIQKPQHSAV